MAIGHGLRVVGRIGGGDPRVREYYIPASNAVALFEGDVVKLSGTDDDPLHEVSGITQFATGDVALGVVVGFRPQPALPYTAYRTASVGMYVEVCDDPLAIYEVQEDAVGGAVSAANVSAMYSADLIIAAGSTATGLSGIMLDSNTAAAAITNLDVKIIGVLRDGVNYAGIAAGAKLLVRLNLPVLA